MSIPRHLKHFLTTKGPRHAVERTGEVVWRFTGGRRRFRRRLEDYQDFFVARGFRLTFCVTASLVKRHRDLFRALADQGHEIAAHGYAHTRMDQYGPARQRELVEASYQALTEAGFKVTGFRAPYLNFNDDTIEALRRSSFSWTSGELLWWQGDRPSTGEVERLRSLYRFLEESEGGLFPRWDGSLVHLPMTAPDDELLFERWKIRDGDELAGIWIDTFRRHHEKGGYHHQFFHPERFPLIRPALDRLLEEVRSHGDAVWTPTLGELATWWREHSAVQQGGDSETSLPRNLGTLKRRNPETSEPRNPGTPEPRNPETPEPRNPEPGTRVHWPHGARSCFVLSADVCAVDLWDFVFRSFEF
ncbi:MAG: hypothetical protein Kow00109_05770 [Acidobacteriota bacterium]